MRRCLLILSMGWTAGFVARDHQPLPTASSMKHLHFCLCLGTLSRILRLMHRMCQGLNIQISSETDNRRANCFSGGTALKHARETEAQLSTMQTCCKSHPLLPFVTSLHQLTLPLVHLRISLPNK